ncbi:PfkB family carbohydrate kinase [Pseudooceanicola sp. 502str34]|uniref:PfkB family carbohydrate kinase n=1 Tax=Maritimibacter alkaliphilus TaxID=404236 RepID=UPI001C9787FE|nr:PfkB family carbohydrate kinase [Maritimibacter alkaliphilus]MBY6089694.1 bifunctional hydroxymethylpyrimidine kinase/phosphomethylpyrimidine kinase [Maritimibacter alkaliphilus]
MTRDLLCIGAVLWDIIGRTGSRMRVGSDVPGRISRLPGGVAMNIAMAAQPFGLRPVLLTAVGRDPEGDELVTACEALGMDVSHVHRSESHPTDRYMAIEGENGLIAAIADAHSLEAAGARILTPLVDGTLGSPEAPYTGPVALDGNLTLALLEEIAAHPAFAEADLRVAPASPGKAERLRPFLHHHRAVLYVNLEEAGLLCGRLFTSAPEAAAALIAGGARRVLVTDGSEAAADGCARREGILSAAPPPVTVARITGAGDTFMAAHVAAELDGADRATALEAALRAAARYVSGESPV